MRTSRWFIGNKLLFVVSFFSLILGARELVQRYFYIPVLRSPLDQVYISQYNRIQLSEVGIDLPIIPADMKGNIFPTTDLGVTLLVSSALPGEPGTSVFYGHNWPRLLGNLSAAQVGQSIQVTYLGAQYHYRISEITSVSPQTKLDLKKSESESELILYTCIGFFDSKRLLVKAIQV